MSFSDFGKRLRDLQEQARKKAEEAQDRFELRERLDEGFRIVGDTTRKVAETVATGVETVKEKAEEINSEHNLTGKVKTAANDAKEKVQKVADKAGETAQQAATQAQEKFKDPTGSLRETVKKAGEQANDFFGGAKAYYEFATGAAETTARSAAAAASFAKIVADAKQWISDNPGKTAIVTFSMIAGTRLGSVFPLLDVAILGAGGAGNWFFHSATAQYGLRKLAEKYADYLNEQATLINSGQLDEAERSRVEFQKNALKYVGAPLLGTFSIAAGATLMYEAFTGGVVTGFPISLILGGNPLLNSIWLFGNGLVCFHNGYKFFMIALADEKEVEKLVRDVKALLPAAVA